MIRISEDQWRRAFSAWLRTGRVPVRNTGGAELKFNPWHDPDDGRFTFAGSGVYYGRGSSRGGDKPKKPSRPKVARRPKNIDGFPSEGGSFGGGGSDATTPPPGSQRQSGGRFGGGGASGSWDAPDEHERRPTATPGKTAKPRAGPAKPREQFRTVEKNGYTYEIDEHGRTRKISGSLTLKSDPPVRSRAAQRQAGGVDRRTSDHGGHYIAARFNGPTEAFNHFAQDANFNRSDYLALENQWAKTIKAGMRVRVTIVPRYNGRSARPARIDVTFVIDGRKESRAFPNERSEKRGGK